MSWKCSSIGTRTTTDAGSPSATVRNTMVDRTEASIMSLLMSRTTSNCIARASRSAFNINKHRLFRTDNSCCATPRSR